MKIVQHILGAATYSVSPCAQLIYDRSRRSLSRTDYEVDFATFFNRLSFLGAKVDPDAYLHPVRISVSSL